MNKDKIIKDLKKRNDSLKMQCEYRNIRCIHLEKENERLQQENQQLKKQKDDIVKALRKLKHRILYEEDFCSEDDCVDEILRMLGEIDE